MSDDEDNDQYDSEDTEGSSKSSLNKYFNKSSSPQNFLNISNYIKLPNGLKLCMDGSVNSNNNYKGKYRLDFGIGKQIQFKLNLNHNEGKAGMSVKYKKKELDLPWADSYDVRYFVDSHQDMDIEGNISKGFSQKNFQISLNPKVEFKNNKINWMMNSKFTYTFPKAMQGVSSKVSLKFKKLTPEITMNSSFTREDYSLFVDYKFSQTAPNYLEKLQLQFKYLDFTSILQYHKTPTLYFHYLLDPYSIGFRVREPNTKRIWELSLNRRLSSKKLVQLSFDEKRVALLLKHTLNSHTNFYLKWYNNYSLQTCKKLKSNLEMGFKFND